MVGFSFVPGEPRRYVAMNWTIMNTMIGRFLIGTGLLLFIVGVVMRRTIPRDDIPNITYLGIYAVACVIMGIGYAVKKYSGA